MALIPKFAVVPALSIYRAVELCLLLFISIRPGPRGLWNCTRSSRRHSISVLILSPSICSSHDTIPSSDWLIQLQTAGKIRLLSFDRLSWFFIVFSACVNLRGILHRCIHLVLGVFEVRSAQVTSCRVHLKMSAGYMRYLSIVFLLIHSLLSFLFGNTQTHTYTHTSHYLCPFLCSDLQSCLICIACRIPRAQPFSTESFITKQDPTGKGPRGIYCLYAQQACSLFDLHQEGCKQQRKINYLV